uniref:Uncharacterized protein n=1 Tax=Bionectria ochroleuca TaxID=29856 RepID=A0A0B7K6M9_BIOOC
MIKSTSESKFKTDMAEESLGRLPMRMAEKSDGRETRPVVAPFPNSAQAPPNSRVESCLGVKNLSLVLELEIRIPIMEPEWSWGGM